jgi:hypothetical protein
MTNPLRAVAIAIACFEGLTWCFAATKLQGMFLLIPVFIGYVAFLWWRGSSPRGR